MFLFVNTENLIHSNSLMDITNVIIFWKYTAIMPFSYIYIYIYIYILLPNRTTFKTSFHINVRKRTADSLIHRAIIFAPNITTFLARLNAASTGNLFSRLCTVKRRGEGEGRGWEWGRRRGGWEESWKDIQRTRWRRWRWWYGVGGYQCREGL